MGLWRASRLPGRPVPADDTGRVRRRVVAGAGWAAAAVVATLIGLGGIRLVGESLTSTPGGVLSQEQVDRALAEASSEPASSEPAGSEPGPPTAGRTGSPAPSPSETPTTIEPTTTGPTAAAPTAAALPRRTFSVRGGNAVAVCQGDLAYLLSWSPNQGYRVDRARQGPDDEVEVRFRGDGGHSEIKISCGGGIPVGEEKEDG